jgi:hypothetical protein
VKHEQSFADEFNAFMRSKALQYGCGFHSFSLDGQDRDAGADYLITDSNRFAIVEFKYTQNDLVSEKHKLRRLTLCRELQNRVDMRAYHDACHFVSWTESSSGQVRTNIYRHEICTQRVFGRESGLSAQEPIGNTWVSAATFARDFFRQGGGRSLSLAEFEGYIAWVLTETSASTTSTLELMAHNPNSNDLVLVRLNSIAQAQEWVRDHVAPPPPRNRRGPRSGI